MFKKTIIIILKIKIIILIPHEYLLAKNAEYIGALVIVLILTENICLWYTYANEVSRKKIPGFTKIDVSKYQALLIDWLIFIFLQSTLHLSFFMINYFVENILF